MTRTFPVLALVGSIAAMPMRARAEDRFATVDMARAINQVDEGKEAKALLKQEFQTKQKKLDGLQAEFKKKHEAFKAKAATLSDEAKALRKDDFEKEFALLKQTKADMQRQLKENEKEGTARLAKKLRAVVDDVAQEQNLAPVLNRGDTVLYQDRRQIPDITDAVIARYNKKHPGLSSTSSPQTRAAASPEFIGRPGKPLTIVIMDLQPVRLSTDVSRLVTELVVARLGQVKGIKAMGLADVQASLNLEKQKDLMGCDSVSCIAEISGAVGAELVVHGTLGALGSQYTLTVAAIRSGHPDEACARVADLFDASEDELARRIPVVVGDLVQQLNDPDSPCDVRRDVR